MSKNLDLIKWDFRPGRSDWPEYESDIVCHISVSRLDAAWRASGGWIGPGGLGGQGDKYGEFGRWIAEGSPIQMCCVCLNDGRLSFTDGRHRFAWLRDNGLKEMPVQVDPNSAESLLQLCGVWDIGRLAQT